MLFLVTGKNIDSGYLLPPDQVGGVISQAVVPSFQLLAQMEEAGKLKGGLVPGERAGAFVIEAASFEELDDTMNRLPFFGLVDWQVKPLMPFSSAVRQLPEYVKEMQQAGRG
jgi:muconolactone delta-isomerase